jgi:RHS repeat-associated protein
VKQTYAYDAWGRMTEVKKGTLRAGFYEYFGDGERFKKVAYDGTTPYEHITLGGYEIEQLKNNMIRYRWAVSGPAGVICWKQAIAPATAFEMAVNRESEYTLATLAGERFLDGLFTPPARSGGPIAFSLATASHSLAAAGDLYAAVSHGARGFSLDPQAQRDAGVLVLLLMGGCIAVLLWSTRARAWAMVLISLHKGGRGALLAPPFAKGGPGGISLPSPPFSKGGPGGISPLGLWNLPAFRFAARALVLVLFFQGGWALVPMAQEMAPEAASPCTETFYPLTDHLGTVVTLLDHNGAVVYTQHFNPFGQKDEANSDKKPSVCNNGEPEDRWPYGFTGQQGDTESGLIYMHARYYNPAIGHFMSPDTVLPSPSDSCSYDRYAYCRNNPINLTDPTGHFFWAPIIGAIVGAVMAAVSGQNIFVGAMLGALTGAMFGAAAGHGIGWTIAAGAASGAISSAVYGGNVLQGAMLGAAGAAIGYGVAKWGGLPASQGGLELKDLGQGVLSIASGGLVGGITSLAMGGDFARGFAYGAVSAGLSWAANEVAGTIGRSSPSETGTNQEEQYKVSSDLGEAPDPFVVEGQLCDLRPQERAVVNQRAELDFLAKTNPKSETEFALMPGEDPIHHAGPPRAREVSLRALFEQNAKKMAALRIKDFGQLVRESYAIGHYHIGLYGGRHEGPSLTDAWGGGGAYLRWAAGKAVFVRDGAAFYFLRPLPVVTYYGAPITPDHYWIKYNVPRSY